MSENLVKVRGGPIWRKSCGSAASRMAGTNTS